MPEHDEAVVVVRDDGVRQTVAIDVADREPLRLIVARVGDRVELLAAEIAGRRLSVDAEPQPSVMEDEGVLAAVGVHVRQDHRLWNVIRGVRNRRIQSPLIVLQESRNEGVWAIPAIAHDNIGTPVAVRIAKCDPLREGVADAQGVGHGRSHGAVGVLKHHAQIRNRVELPTHHDQVGPTIPVDVARDERVPAAVRRVIGDGRCQRPGRGLQQDIQAIAEGSPVDPGNIQAPVAVEVTNLHLVRVD